MINKMNKMKARIRLMAGVLMAVCVLAACRDEMPDMQNPRTDINIYNWSQLFESYWSGMNYNYVFWDIDPTDWDAVYDEYKPKFDALADKGFSDKETNDEAFGMLEELSSGLIDGHFILTLTLPSDTVSYLPSLVRKEQRPNYHPFDEQTLVDYANMLLGLHDAGRFSDARLVLAPESGNALYASGILDEDIVYFRLSSFMLTEHVGTGDAVDRIVANYHDLLDNYPTVGGVIIDVRQNSGGYLVDMPLVLGKLVNEETLMCYTRQKGGIGRLDYTPWVPEMLKPTERVRELDVPIVVMADMNSISMAEMTTRAVQTLPNGCFIGEQTYGGQGTLINSNSGFNMFYGGYFSNNAMRVYTTMTMTKGVDGVIAEGKGLVPDIEVPFDGENLKNGVDTQLERAVQYIRTGE